MLEGLVVHNTVICYTFWNGGEVKECLDYQLVNKNITDTIRLIDGLEHLRNLLGGRTPGHFIINLIVALVSLLAIIVAGNAEGRRGKHVRHGQYGGSATTCGFGMKVGSQDHLCNSVCWTYLYAD